MIDYDEARERGLGGPRGCLISGAIVWAVIVIAIFVLWLIKHHH